MFILIMENPFRILFLALIILSHSKPSCSSKPISLTKGSWLSVDKKDDYLISQNRLFTAGFYSVGYNAYSFSVWFTEPLSNGSLTVVWMANRDTPVNGKHSKLSLMRTGNLVLKDAGLVVWTSRTRNLTASLELKLNDTGNLFLQNSDGGVLWQSFDSPTDTLLPNQDFTKLVQLVSSASLTNYSSGNYKLYYDDDNVLRLLYNTPSISSVYWPDPTLRAWDAGRNTFLIRRTANLNSTGYFLSSDALAFYSSDYGDGPLRRLTLDTDGNVRLYSLDQNRRTWLVSWQAISQPCTIHGICGVNSTCSHGPKLGRKCSCLPRHTMVNENDWSYGCRPEFKPTLCGNNEDVFIHLRNVQFFGFEALYFPNYTIDGCRQKCLSTCNCKGYQIEFDIINGYYHCYVKFRMFSGWSTGNFNTSFYLKLPKNYPLANRSSEGSSLKCVGRPRIQLARSYEKKHESWSIKFMLYFTFVVGGLEVTLIMIFVYKTRVSSSGKRIQGYIQAATGFKRFSYAELKRASGNFRDEIGSGGGGVVYKGKLSDGQVVAIKRLKEASVYQGEAEFLAEMSTIGRVNHMNLIAILGYCAEGKHRLMVYEFMEHGSLAENLRLGNLDWEKRYEIAVGTARGLAYLHEECLEWVLHCDVKPHNILLDASYQAKVADFGLSKLLERGGGTGNSFSRARGTRGYMAPEWVSNLPITSKVDVYSYGVVVLEMITGRKPTGGDHDGGMDQRRLISWVKEKLFGGDGWMEEILDPTMNGECDIASLENLAKIALRCVDEDKDERPTMSQVVNMLLHPENDQY